MKTIYFDSDNNIEITSVLENIKSFDQFLFEYIDTIQKLAGIMIIIDGKILLVKPNKFREEAEKWSIPKGKVSKGENIMDTAIRELEEETGINIPKEKIKTSERIKIYYKKSNKIKELTAFVIRLNKKDLDVDINKKWEIHKKHFDKDEVYKVKFFTKLKALDKLEMGQTPLLKLIR